MTLFDAPFFLCRKVSENLAQMRPQLTVKKFAAVFGNENDVIFAVPLYVT